MIWVEFSREAWNVTVTDKVIKRRVLAIWEWTPLVIVRLRKPYRFFKWAPR